MPEAARRRLWRALILSSTWSAYAGYYFCRKSFYAAKEAMGRDLDLDATALAHLGVAYLVAYTLGQFSVAALGQRLGPRAMLLGGMGISLGTNIVFGFADSYWTVMAFMIVNGFAQATGWSACMGTLGHWTTREERGTVMGLWSTCYQLGGVMATSWAGLWLAVQGWRGAFFAGSVVLMGSWIFVFFAQRNRPQDVGLPSIGEQEDSDGGSTSPEAVARRAARPTIAGVAATLALVGVCYFGIKFVRYTVWSWSAYFLTDYFSVEPARAALYSTIFDWGGFIGVIVAGYLSDRVFAGRRAKLSFYLLMGMSAACLLLATVGTRSVEGFLISMILVGFMLYGPDSLLSGAGAIDIGGGSARIAILAAGVINGMGSAGSVFQELVVARLYASETNKVAPVFAALFVASTLALVALGGVLWRNRRGYSDL